ncbi:MAG: ATP-dependent Clp protease proteolytic subunit [Myxococcales bacterium]|nr:ATP-dependent Clp protease proteolytic subunit [Myxococcales bacterium]
MTPPSAPPRDPGDAALTLLRPAAEALYGSRTVLLFGEIDADLARSVTAQLVALAADGDAPIRMLVSSPGGHVESGDTIHDVVRAIGPEVTMIGTGWVASAAALVYVAVPRERRIALRNTRFLLHQPLGGVSGPSSDLEIEARQILLIRDRLHRTFAEAMGQDVATIAGALERNYWLSAAEAVEQGLVGRVVDRLSAIGDRPAK